MNTCIIPAKFHPNPWGEGIRPKWTNLREDLGYLLPVNFVEFPEVVSEKKLKMLKVWTDGQMVSDPNE